MRALHLLVLTASVAALPVVAMANSTVNVGPFHAVGLSGGGEVTVRQGDAQSVRLVSGDAEHTRFTLQHGASLRIENCVTRCPRDYHLKVEITVPTLTALAVSDGGMLRAEGAFPEQATIAAAVNEGGIVDMRAVPARQANAAVNEGGRVVVTANATLNAAVNDGGSITYWGNPSSIHKAIHDGGSIVRGDGRSDRFGEHVSLHVPPAPPAPPRPARPANIAAPPAPPSPDAYEGGGDSDVDADDDMDDDMDSDEDNDNDNDE